MAEGAPTQPQSRNNVPVPDPTLLTTQQLLREIAALRDQIGREVVGSREILETRLNAMDKAIELLRAGSDLIPGRIDEKIQALRDVHEERFMSIQKQFSERDVRDERSTRDSKTAVDAALQAAKEAVGEQNRSSALAIAKSEAATDKRIDQQGIQMQTAAGATDDKIGDIKERLTRIEGRDLGATATQTRTTQSNQWAVGVGIGVAGLLVSLAVLASKVFH